MNYSRIPNIERMTSLKVDNLSNQTTPEDLKKFFEKFGDVGDVHFPRHSYKKGSRGFAFVRFYDCRSAEAAMDSLAGHTLDGRKLRVEMSTNSRRMQSMSRSRSRSRSHSRSRRSCSCSRRHRSCRQIGFDSCHHRDDRRSRSCSCSRSHTRIVSDSCHHTDDRRSRFCPCSRRHTSCTPIRSHSRHRRDDRSRSCSCSKRHRSCTPIRSDSRHHRDDRSRSSSSSRRRRSCAQIRSDNCHLKDDRFTSLLHQEIRESSEPRSRQRFDDSHQVPENSKLSEDSSSDLTSAESLEDDPNHSGNGRSVGTQFPLEIGILPQGQAPLKLSKMTFHKRRRTRRIVMM